MFDGSAAKTGEDVIAAVERETAALAAKQAGAQPAPAQTSTPDDAEKPQLLDFLAAAPEAEGDPYADQPTVTAPELPELTPAQELAGYIRRFAALFSGCVTVEGHLGGVAFCATEQPGGGVRVHWVQVDRQRIPVDATV